MRWSWLRVLALLVSTSLGQTPAIAQEPRGPRVHVDHLRGPISARELRDAWSPRRFRRCAAEPHAEVAHLHVRVEPDGSIDVEHGAPGPSIPFELRCVVEVLTTAQFQPQTEPTHAYVIVDFRPPAVPHRAPTGRDDRRK